MARFALPNHALLVENSSAVEETMAYLIDLDIDFGKEHQRFEGDPLIGYLPGQLVARLTARYEIDATNQTLLGGILGDNTNPRFVRYRPLGALTASPQWSCDAVLTKFGPSGQQASSGRLVGEAVFEVHTEASATPAWS